MNSVRISKISSDYLNINLNNGVNYIFGRNGSGKTSLFRMIKYLMGASERLDNTLIYGSASIHLSQGEKEVLIESRNKRTDKYSQQKIYDLISRNIYVANKRVIIEDDKQDEYLLNFIRNIIKESFFSDFHENSLYQIDSKLSLLGIDKGIERRYKKLIAEIDEKKQYKEEGLVILNEFSKKLEDKLIQTNKDIDRNSYNDSVQTILLEYKNDVMEYLSLSDELKTNMHEIANENEDVSNRVFFNLDHQFNDILSRLNLQNIPLRNAYLGSNRTTSQSENTLYTLIAKLVMQAGRDYTNGLGLLVCDDPFIGFDKDMIQKVRSNINNICCEYNIQYIEFTTNPYGIEKSRNVYEIQNGFVL